MLDQMLTWLLSPAIVVWGTPLSNAECFGFISGLCCVWLTVLRSIWNFPLGIINCALLLFLFFEQRLYADAGLQVFFIVLGLQGWLLWLRGRIEQQVPVSRLSIRQGLYCAVANVPLVAGLYFFLVWLKGSIPLFDALITGMSLMAQLLLNLRKLENWLLWIAVDVISIPVYIHKDLYLIAMLYAVFLCMCVYGYWQWRRVFSLQTVAQAK